jgi:hypothetical protein
MSMASFDEISTDAASKVRVHDGKAWVRVRVRVRVRRG